ncbi:MAG: hypothetical protein ACRBCK_10170 [Alphaproteobacteria bacterium]
MIKNIIFGQIRHLLTSAGGGLITAGYLSVDELSTVVGAAMILIGMVFSYFEKRKREGASLIPKVKPHYNSCFILLAVLLLGGCTTLSQVIEAVTDVSCAKQVELSSEVAVKAGQGVVLANVEGKIDVTKRNQLLNALLDVHTSIEKASAVCDLGGEGQSLAQLEKVELEISKIIMESGE